VRRADNLTTFMCRLSRNLGASTSWNPVGLSRPVMGLLYLFFLYEYVMYVIERDLKFCFWPVIYDFNLGAWVNVWIQRESLEQNQPAGDFFVTNHRTTVNGMLIGMNFRVFSTGISQKTVFRVLMPPRHAPPTCCLWACCPHIYSK
jgi:hypothetical protein